jgi:hypothetical protein
MNWKGRLEIELRYQLSYGIRVYRYNGTALSLCEACRLEAPYVVLRVGDAYYLAGRGHTGSLLSAS